MAKTAIREVPTTLPRARIYLDEIIEIEALLLESFQKQHPGAALTFAYRVDGQIQYTTTEELKDHGGHAIIFDLVALPTEPERFYSYDRSVLSFTRLWAPRLHLRGFDSEEWELFAKIEQIFKSRPDRLAAAFEGQSYKLLIFFLVIPLAITALIPQRFLERHIAISIAVGAAWVVLGILTLYLSLRRSRVYFRFARQDKQARERLWLERLEKLVWLIVGVLLGTLGTVATNHFRK